MLLTFLVVKLDTVISHDYGNYWRIQRGYLMLLLLLAAVLAKDQAAVLAAAAAAAAAAIYISIAQQWYHRIVRDKL